MYRVTVTHEYAENNNTGTAKSQTKMVATNVSPASIFAYPNQFAIQAIRKTELQAVAKMYGIGLRLAITIFGAN
ncbi:MAG: hypothetical protein AAF664_13075 [Planctomycetota bacterium]